MALYRALAAIVALLAMLCVPFAQADVIIGQHTWDTGAEGWTTEFGDVNIQRLATGGNPDGWLEITFPPTALDETGEVEWYDIVHVSGSSLFAGAWLPGWAVAFDFYAGDQTPQDLQLKFSATNGNIWSQSIVANVTQTQTWTTIHSDLSYASGWGGLPGYDDTLDQFVSDLSSINWIGLYIWREEAGSELYGLDDFQLHVPEPAELALALTALAASGCSMRRRKRRRLSA